MNDVATVEETPALDILETLEAALPNLAQAVAQKHLGKALIDASQACREMPAKIARLEELIVGMTLLEAYLPTRKVEIEAPVDRLCALGDSMEAAASVADLEQVARDVRKIDPDIAALHRSVATMADAYVRDHVAPLGALDRLLRKLGRPDIADRIERLRTLSLTVGTTGNVQPQRIEALQTARSALATDLTALASDPEVDAFLSAFARSGAVSLERLTHRVLDWLESQGALAQFTVQSVS